ncbi:DUF7344 domain-containing protein [Haloprofundus halobius]|uniref:DUF7344 domain-containing protein n=1 Tax=Haloprofundus halobius TaxID=2876194 RepID=UPI001CC9358C|nr:ArsR family transcriptional regulator [Haloprofundus halobius]
MMKPTRNTAADRAFGYLSGGSLENIVADAVRHPRRRRVLAHLIEQQRPVLLEDLAAVVARREYDSPSDEEIEGVLTSLYHQHLPKLAAANVVEYGGEGDWISVELTEDATPLQVSLEASLGEEVNEYYTT